MKIAVSGKGGTGKTTIAATLARSLSRRGHRVLAIDCDSNPNLAASLGLDEEKASAIRTLPKRAFDESKSVGELLDQFAVVAPDDVHLVLAARIDQAAAG